MERREFIRVLGGGAVFAATAGLPGCSRGMPPRAIQAWKGPGAEAGVRRWILGYAILAPHSHNLQSWLVDLKTQGEITLYCDPTRLLPETDPYGRQIMMSHGTFLELLDLAARERALRADIELFPEGEFGPGKIDQRPVARIRLTSDPAIAKDPLFAQVLKRRTSREKYDLQRPVGAEAVRAMAESVRPHPVRFGFAGADAPEVLKRHRAVAAEAWKIELTTPRTVLESYRVLRIGAAEIEKHRDGIALNDPFVTLMARLGLFDRTKPPKPGDSAIKKQIEEFDGKLEATPGFLWMVTAGNDRKTQVNAGRAYARVQLAGTAHGLSMQPLSQALQEYPEQQASYARIHELAGASRPDHTVQMWARVGHGPRVEPAPRRGVSAHVLKGGQRGGRR